jgi:hypothetical protein
MKQCSTCKETKPLSEFYNLKKAADGKHGRCKACCDKTTKTWRINNPDKVKEHDNRWAEKHRIRCRDNAKKWAAKYPDRVRARVREWQKNNPEKRKEHARKAKTNHNIRLHLRMTNVIYKSLRLNKAGRSWESLVGYTLDDLRRHLEKHFLPGMSWENMGKWHIDHIIPKAAFNYEYPEDIDFKNCWALKNLQPLWAIDNVRKGTKTEKPHQPSLAMAL